LTKIKICGLKREEDICFVNELKPQYAGFIFAKSKRQVNKEQAAKLIKALDKSIKKVGVFLNQSMEEVKETARYCSLDILQFHGEEEPEYCRYFRKEIWKAFRVKGPDSIQDLKRYEVDGFLLDTFVEGEYGGTGKAFNWQSIMNLLENRFIILAGGLTPENVREAIHILKPAVVDVSSGVETDGVKDFEKMKKFAEKVRG
jgi:phosphoribosylanthranilate isomerase